MGLFPLGKSRTRRSVRSSVWGSGLDPFEDRTLLSGVAIYPQPAAVAGENVDATAAPPADFSGDWSIDGLEVPAVAVIKQNGNQAQVFLIVFGTDIIEIEADGKIKGDTAKIKVNESTEGFRVKGKISATLNTPTEMSGTAKAKVAGLGKFTIPFTGTEVD